MSKMMVFIGTTLGSAIGWWLGYKFGIMTAFILSMVGFGFGMWGGKRLAEHWGV